MNKMDYEELKTKIDTARVEELRYYWNQETEDEDTQEWREEVTDVTEQLLIKAWDDNYNAGLFKLCESILEAEKKFNEARKLGGVTE